MSAERKKSRPADPFFLFVVIRGRSLKILDTTTFAFFLFVLVGLIGFRWMILATYMSLLVNVTLTAIAWGSLLARVPFTMQ
jgi:hypothetical protein